MSEYRITSVTDVGDDEKIVVLTGGDTRQDPGPDQSTPTPAEIRYGRHRFLVKQRLDAEAGQMKLRIAKCLCPGLHPPHQLSGGKDLVVTFTE